MWSTALDAILTTLRYLAPATLLTLFWGQQSFLFKILKNIDSAFRSIVFSSEEQKQAVLKWLADAGPVRVDQMDTVWKHGWILCGVLDAALPGACAGHPPTKLSLKHAQTIADHYLGVEPVFSRQELESNDSLSRHQEWKLATYLDRIREALTKLTPPVSKPVSQRTSPETTQFTLDYVAKGSGLIAAQLHNKMSFKIYPTAQQSLDPREITVLIRGPKETYGMAVIPPILGKAQLIRQKLLGLQAKQTFTENVLPITQGATYLRSYGKNDMNKTYYIPKEKYSIEIEVESQPEQTKISYVVNLEGKYEVSITTRGQNIAGSPFSVTASHNIFGLLEKENYSLEDGEEIDIVDVKTDRKVVLRIVDFVTEKMLLKENGSLEKISEDEARILMNTDIGNERSSSVTEFCDIINANVDQDITKSYKFNTVAHKILKMNRVCKVLNELMDEKHTEAKKKQSTAFINTRSQQDIPDIVNSTFSDTNMNPFVMAENIDKFIVPEHISVSIRTEKSKSLYEEDRTDDIISFDNAESHLLNQTSTPSSYVCTDQITIIEEQIEDDNISVDRLTPLGSKNPFLTDICDENYSLEKNLGTFVTSEYENNSSQNEETRESSIKICISKNTPSPESSNPFMDSEILEMERPRTPLLKIMAGEKTSREDSVYVDITNKYELIPEEMLGNEFVNPFFMHHLQANSHYEQTPITDFIIGAPVSLPPIIRAPSPDPHLRTYLNSSSKHLDQPIHSQTENEIIEKDISTALFSSPSKQSSNSKNTLLMDNKSAISSTFHSLDSNLPDNIDSSNILTTSDTQYERFQIDASQMERNLTPKKDIWDSAYVSIDDNNSSPDSNNNDNATQCDTISKQKFSLSDDSRGLKQEEITNMGPAEREIWQMCTELNEPQKVQEEVKSHKWELKRPMFTPIIEESDRSISSGIKDIPKTEINIKKGEADPVTVAFAELNDIYDEYYPNSDCSSTTAPIEDNKLQSLEVDYTIETSDTGVDSASEALSDVMRHEPETEGAISEVQINVTESVSASQCLHDLTKDKPIKYDNNVNCETQFGDKKHSNIVLERKKYWDEKIRQIAAKSEESTTLQKKRRISSKQLKHNDSLSKRRGKQIVKNFLSSGENQIKYTKQVTIKRPEIAIHTEPIESNSSTEDVKSNEKLVEKWKKYWDEKLEVENNELEVSKTKSPKHQHNTADDANIDEHDSTEEVSVPLKQELPEEVFKAFETSPKRFFGTSRKHILNKIDTFLGKPSSVDDPTTDISGISPDSGLVSSRITLFHHMSNTEPLSWATRKSRSLHNIHMRKDSEKSNLTEDKHVDDSASDSDIVFIVQSIDTDSGSEKVSSNNSFEKETDDIPLDVKRNRMIQMSNDKSFDAPGIPLEQSDEIKEPTEYIKTTTKVKNKSPSHIEKYKKNNILCKTSISKSEMDIFNKVPNDSENVLDTYKSCDELPKINVKSFISLYENVTKTAVDARLVNRIYKTNSADSQRLQTISINSDAENKAGTARQTPVEERSKSSTSTRDMSSPESTPVKQRASNLSIASSVEISEADPKTDTNSIESDIQKGDKETTYISLSDIELEIVENSSVQISPEPSPERTADSAHKDYKNRFKMAKQYFQSLEELRDIKKPRKLNECELLLLNKSSESLENERPQKRLKRKTKSHSMPSSELAKAWNQMQDQNQNQTCSTQESSSKLVKISEKFNVDDLFNDVMKGRLSRQGSLRGIPHKKAVLEAFKSMENLTDNKLSPYELATSQFSDFTQENKIKSAQNYLSEYPYLPTTDPSKYHSRLDTKASGLISFKELLESKGRRNSVPDLRLNPKFTAEL